MSKNKVITMLVLFFSVLISMFVLNTPIPNTEDETVFNTKIAIEHIAQISKEPHSVFDEEAHDEVRDYIIDQLNEFIGSDNVSTFLYDKSEFLDDDGNEITYDVENVLGVIPGSSDTAIMIVAHYDSRGHIGRTGELGESYGAADDGYGLAVMLEIARLYGEKELENTIYLLFTDAEETGLFGANKATDESFMENVGFIINIEARGVDGPAYMFETSVNNSKVIEFYRNAEMEVSYSLATAVYTVMPNYTDFTEFLEAGKTGINFSVLKGLNYYHTPHDNYTNIDASSIEHYGRQIMPLVEEFSMNSEYSDLSYFDSDTNDIFFNLLPGVFVNYNEGFGSFLHILFFVLFIALTGYIISKKDTSFKHIGISFGLVIAVIIDAVIVGYIVGRVIAYLSKVPYSITYVRSNIGGIPTLITLCLITVVYGYLYKLFINTNERKKSIVISGVFINLLLAVLTGFSLSGASFLFFVPGVSGLVLLFFMTFCKKPNVKFVVVNVIFFFNIVLVLPILYSLYLALTVGGLLALGVILVFYLFTVIPGYFVAIE